MPTVSIGKTYDLEDCALLAIEHPPVIPESRVSLIDYSYSIQGNDFDHNRWEKHEEIAGNPSFIYTNLPVHLLPTDHILVTDEVLPSGSSRPEDFPLFYQYKLRWDHWSEFGDVNSIQIIRWRDGRILSKEEYRVEYGTTSYYPSSVGGNGWQSTPPNANYNRIRLLLPEYVVRNPDGPFVVQYTRWRNGVVEQNWSEFINPEPLFAEGVNYVISADEPLILLQVGADEVALTGMIYVKKADWSRIFPDYPAGTEWTEWNPKIFGGSVWEKDGEDDRVFDVTKDIALLQPTVTASGDHWKIYDDVLLRVDEKTLQTNHWPVFFTTSGYPGQWEVTPGTSKDQASPSGSEHGIVIKEDDNIVSNFRIEDWDFWHGLIKLDKTRENAKYSATYLIENKWLFLRGIDLNPRRRDVKNFRNLRMISKNVDTSVLENPVQVYVLPNNGHLPGSAEGNVFWGYTGISTLGKVWSSNPTDPSWNLLPGVGGEPGTHIRLADYSVVGIEKSELVLTDIRQRGGGVLESKAGLLHEVDYYSDIGVWDGIPSHLEGVIIVQIPLRIRQDAIDRFERAGWLTPQATVLAEEWVHKGIQKFIPAGALYYILDENGNYWPGPIPRRYK